MEVKENNSSTGEWPSTYSLQQKTDDGLYRLTIITFKFSFFSNGDCYEQMIVTIQPAFLVTPMLQFGASP